MTACTQCGKRTTPDSIHTCSPQVLRDETLLGADKYAGLREALADGATVIAGDFVRELLSERDALMAAGGALSNCAFNLAQRNPDQFTARDIKALDQCRKDWDIARSKGKDGS